MVFLLSRRYTRVITYLIVVCILGVTIYHYLISSWIEEHRFQRQLLTEEYDIDSLLEEHGIDPSIKANDHIMVNIGVKHCYHLFNVVQWCPKSTKLYNNLSSYQTKRLTISKDITGSVASQWWGLSMFYFYEVMEISSLIPLLIGDDKPIKHVPLHGFNSMSVGENIKKCNVKFDRFCLSPVDLNLEVVKTTKSQIITDFTVLFGDDCVDPRPDWTLLKDQGPIYDQFSVNSYLTYKDKILSDRDVTVNLKPDQNGKFKIVQLADLHMGVGKGKCIDEFPASKDSEHCEADPKTIAFINKVLDLENPQLVVFTGDQIMGDKSLQDSETTLLKALAPVIKRNIPWAMVWGNHDDEGSLSRWQLSELVTRLPYTLFEFSELDTHDNSFGVGNYIKQVKDDQDKPLITLYFLDSHKYSKAGKISPGYDWIKEKQWEYMKHIYDDRLKPALSQQNEQLSMAFFHIPLPEYLDQQSKQNPKENNEIVGQYKEGVTAPKYNSGGLSTLQEMGVQVTSCGHDHCNDYCLQDDSTPSKIWLCYGGSAGEGAYAGYGGTERRIRTYELDTKSGTIKTWKRLNGTPNETFDYQILVQKKVISYI